MKKIAACRNGGCISSAIAGETENAVMATRARTYNIAIVRQSLAAANDVCGLPDVQAIFHRRRRAKTKRTPQAKIRPGSPVPTMGPGTANGFQPIDSIIANSGELVV